MVTSRRILSLPCDARCPASKIDRWNESQNRNENEWDGFGSSRKQVRFALDRWGGTLCEIHEISQYCHHDLRRHQQQRKGQNILQKQTMQNDQVQSRADYKGDNKGGMIHRLSFSSNRDQATVTL